ncbi:MAG: FAD-binding oxidoreductase [Proteobacteria bacterium]|nr:FAD-binding oxidoreductase [Pseudomonadota bacterium]
MSQHYDVVIVGGGAVGSSSAYWLTADPAFNGRVLVVERDPSYARASTTLSLGSIRQQFSTPENIRLSAFGMHFLKHLGDYLTLDGEIPEVSYLERGYLFLASEAGLPVLEANHRTQQALGATNAILRGPELASRFPWLCLDGLAAGSLGLAGEGWFDPYALLQAFRRKARAQGAVYLTDEVVSLARESSRLTGLTLASGEAIQAGVVVNAAGPHAGKLARMAGLTLPVAPKKRFVYVFECREKLEPPPPLVIDATGVFVRPEGRGYVSGVSPPADQDPDCEDLEVEYGLWEDLVWPTLAHRIPAFAAVKLTRAWAGHYDYNTLDQNGILGPHPEVSNFLFANGFSGHGIQQSPAVGRAISEWIIHGGWRSIDLSRFGYGRIAQQQPLLELNVV